MSMDAGSWVLDDGGRARVHMYVSRIVGVRCEWVWSVGAWHGKHQNRITTLTYFMMIDRVVGRQALHKIHAVRVSFLIS